ncbi:hypothetical protein SFRURICE_018551, partial [Spodoptera frugiperda]
SAAPDQGVGTENGTPSSSIILILVYLELQESIWKPLRKAYVQFFRDNQFSHRKCRTPVPHLQSNYPKRNTIKLATVQITPTLKLLSFRVSKNYLYLSLARPGTDLLEFKELCTNEG